MNAQSHTKQEPFDKVFRLLESLGKRISRIEEYLEIEPERTVSSGRHGEMRKEKLTSDAKSPGASLEFKIGEYWIARLGTAALFLGIAFFISYPFETFPPLAASLLGYLAVAGLFGLSRYWKTTYAHLSKILFGGGLVLLYFATLRLHFFSSNPVLSNKSIGLAAIVAVLTLIFYFAVKRDSELLTGLACFLGYTTSLLSDTSHFALLLITLTSFASGYFLVRYNWQKTFGFSMVLTYLAFLMWMLNNPLLGKPLQAVSEPHGSLLYIFLSATIFGVANLIRKRETHSYFSGLLLESVNAVGFFVVGSLAIITFFKPQLAVLNLIVSVFFIALAIANWVHHQSKYASSVYALFGYLALTIAIFNQFISPQYFIWLSWQSLVVISTAIWFRSRIIIVANLLIFWGILLAYLGTAPSSDFVNLSYAIVALVSARILNWRKERLRLKTDMIRIAYLASAFSIVLYGLYQAVPGNYVSLSWLAAALFYFAMSLLLHNIKYRWMAILTIFATILRVIFIDMAQLEAGFRVVFFVGLGLALLAVSLLYTKFRRKTEGE